MEGSQDASGEPGPWLLTELDWFGIKKHQVHPCTGPHTEWDSYHQKQPEHSKSNAHSQIWSKFFPKWTPQVPSQSFQPPSSMTIMECSTHAIPNLMDPTPMDNDTKSIHWRE